MANGVHTERFLKYIWPFYNIMHERVKCKTMSEISILIFRLALKQLQTTSHDQDVARRSVSKTTLDEIICQ